MVGIKVWSRKREGNRTVDIPNENIDYITSSLYLLRSRKSETNENFGIKYSSFKQIKMQTVTIFAYCGQRFWMLFGTFKGKKNGKKISNKNEWSRRR